MRILAAVLIFLFAASAMPMDYAAPTAQLIAKTDIKSATNHPSYGQADIVKTANRAARTATNAFDSKADSSCSRDVFADPQNVQAYVGIIKAAAPKFLRILNVASYKRKANYSGFYICRLPGRSPPHVIA